MVALNGCEGSGLKGCMSGHGKGVSVYLPNQTAYPRFSRVCTGLFLSPPCRGKCRPVPEQRLVRGWIGGS